MTQRFVRYHPMVRKSEKERLMLVGVAGLTCLLLTVFIFVLHNRSEASLPTDIQAPVDPVRPAIGTVTLLAPEANVPAGTKLASVQLREVYWPRNQVPEGAIRDSAEIKGLYAKSALTQGFPLVRTSLTSQASTGTLQVRPGFRALSIDVDAISGLEGHALPGTHVDVLLTFLKDEVKTTKILVQNARVLSYGGVVENDLESAVARAAKSRASLRRRALSSSITLEVGIKDALKIQTARQMGKLGLMMRPQDDAAPAPADITYMDRNDVAGGDRGKRVAKNTRTCTKGRIRVSGQEYMLGCDGTLSQVLDPYEP